MGVYIDSDPPAPVVRRRIGLGLEIEPKTALLGVGALMLVFFLLGERAGPKRRARRKAKREKKISELRQQIKELETERIKEFEGE